MTIVESCPEPSEADRRAGARWSNQEGVPLRRRPQAHHKGEQARSDTQREEDPASDEPCHPAPVVLEDVGGQAESDGAGGDVDGRGEEADAASRGVGESTLRQVPDHDARGHGPAHDPYQPCREDHVAETVTLGLCYLREGDDEGNRDDGCGQKQMCPLSHAI